MNTSEPHRSAGQDRRPSSGTPQVLDPLGPAQIAALGEIGEQLRTHVRGECAGAAAHQIEDASDC